MAAKRMRTPLTDDERAAAAEFKRLLLASPKSQDQIAGEIGVTQGAVWQWAEGKVAISSKRAQSAAAAVGGDPSAISVAFRALAFGPDRSASGTASAASESFLVRLDPAMLAEAEKLAEIAAAIGRQEHTRLQKMEIVAALYPKLLANGGELTRGDYEEFIRAAEAQRTNTGSPDDQSPASRATRHP